MVRYDLSSYRVLSWVRLMRGFRVGLIVFGAAGILWAVYGFYVRNNLNPTDSLSIIGDMLVMLVFGLFLFYWLALRPQALAISIDESGVRLDFQGGRSVFNAWSDPRVSFRGRRTPGVNDSVSRGRALWSVYGRFGGFSETFIPERAYDDLRLVSECHGLKLSERSVGLGWTLYTLYRPRSEPSP